MFRSYDVVDDKIYEIHMAKKKIVHEEPILVGFIVLNNARQRMLEFRLNFLGRIMPPKTSRVIVMDTDSYMALTEKSLYECFTNVAKTELKENDDLYHRQENCCQPNIKMNFLTRSCCQKHTTLDKEHLGFPKLNGMEPRWSFSTARPIVFLRNKKKKMALKGSDKTLDSPLELFKIVLFEKEPYEGSNKGFHSYMGKMFTYRQNKMSIIDFY